MGRSWERYYSSTPTRCPTCSGASHLEPIGGRSGHTTRCCSKPWGEPDVEPDDRTAVERVIREEGVEMARCRTGSSLRQYEDDFPELKRFPNLAWYASQAPSSWPRQ